MSFSKKTKPELKAIADELDVDIRGISLKKAIADKIAASLVENFDYHVNNGTKYAKSARYYKHGSPTKSDSSSIPDAFTSPTKSSKTIIYSADDDTDEAEEVPPPSAVVEEVTDEDDEVAELPSKFENFKDYLEDKYYELELYILEKNYDLRDYLSDPYQINKFVTYYEFASLVSYYYETVPIAKATFVPQLIKDNLPPFILSTSVPDVAAFTSFSVLSTYFVWFVTLYLIPSITSYYVNFSYDFETDPFIYALSKVFYGVLLFKFQIPPSEIKKELAYSITSSSYSLSYFSKVFQHNLLESTLLLRGLFGNWDVIFSSFAAVVAFYAQSQIDPFDEDFDDEDDYDDYEDFEGYSDEFEDEDEHTHSHSH